MDSTLIIPMFGDLVLDIPRYFTIFGFKVYYYALCIVLGYGLAALYLIRRRSVFGLTADNILDLLLIAVPCGIIGARIYYIIFNYGDFFGPGKWGNIFNFRGGGLAVYGGIIFSLLVAVIYSKKKKINPGSIFDAAAFGLFIGQAIGRWGNFINVEAYGVETDLPWKMGVSSYGVTTYHHPTFFYESAWNAAGLLIMHIFSKRYKSKYPGQYFLFYVTWYGLGRCMIEGLRIDSLYIPGTELRVSQWLAALSALIALSLLIFNNINKTKLTDPGAATDETGGETDGEADADAETDDAESKPDEEMNIVEDTPEETETNDVMEDEQDGE